jgi:hypothetical protein
MTSTRKAQPPEFRCIYCGASGALSDEHVVPYGLSGTQVIPWASCESCRDITSQFERNVQRALFIEPRVILGLKTRRPAERPTAFTVILKKADGVEETRAVAVADYPGFYHVPIFEVPAYIKPWKYRKGVRIRGAVSGFLIRDKAKILVDSLKKEIGVQDVSFRTTYEPAAFAQMLAKIAHGICVLHFGRDFADRSYLGRTIRLEVDDAGKWVGSVNRGHPTSRTPELHQMEVRISTGIVRVHIKLFSLVGGPEYVVFVGPAPGNSRPAKVLRLIQMALYIRDRILHR